VKNIFHIWKTEKRFWELFRLFLLPIGLMCFVIFLVSGIAAACGKNAIFDNGQPITGWRAVLYCLAGWPIFTFLFSGLAAFIVFVERTVFPSIGKILFRRK
jgi:hypothetical protein